PVGQLANDDAVERSHLLQPCGGVDHIARDHDLAALWVGGEFDDRLAGVHGRSQRELCARSSLVQLGDCIDDPERSCHGADGVVLVRSGRAEDAHHGVADELLNRAAEALDLLLRPAVVRAQELAYVLRVGPLRACGEANEVGEEDRDDLPFLYRPIWIGAHDRSKSRPLLRRLLALDLFSPPTKPGLRSVRSRCREAANGQCPRQESNLRTRFRKPLLYPLSYGGAGTTIAPLQAKQAVRRVSQEPLRTPTYLWPNQTEGEGMARLARPGTSSVLMTAAATAGVLLALGSSASGNAASGTAPVPGNFVRRVDNPWFPLTPGTTFVYRGVKDGKASRDVYSVTFATKKIQGVLCTAVRDRLFLAGRLSER